MIQVSVETTSELGRRLTITVPADDVENLVDKKLKETAKKVRINGFRQGKVPLSEVKRRYGVAVRGEALDELVLSRTSAAVEQESLKVAGRPSIEISQDQSGAPLEFVATLEVFPTIAALELSTLKIDRPIAEVIEADLDQAILKLQEQKVKWLPKEGQVAALGDQVTLDFEGRVEGELFDGGAQKNHVMVLGAKKMIAGFEEQIVGMQAGEQRTIQVTFPTDYVAEALKGKKAEFLITLHSVEQPLLPELNANFFRDYGVSSDDLALFRSEVRKNLIYELNEGKRLYLRLQVIEGLLKSNPIDVPKSLIELESRRLRDQQVRQMLGQEELPAWAENFPTQMFHEEAERVVRASLLLDGIRTLHAIELDAERVKARVEQLAARYQSPEEVVQWFYQSQREMQQIQQRVLEDQIIDHVLSIAQVEDKPLSYEEVLRGPQVKAFAEQKE